MFFHCFLCRSFSNCTLAAGWLRSHSEHTTISLSVTTSGTWSRWWSSTVCGSSLSMASWPTISGVRSDYRKTSATVTTLVATHVSMVKVPRIGCLMSLAWNVKWVSCRVEPIYMYAKNAQYHGKGHLSYYCGNLCKYGKCPFDRTLNLGLSCRQLAFIYVKNPQIFRVLSDL